VTGVWRSQLLHKHRSLNLAQGSAALPTPSPWKFWRQNELNLHFKDIWLFTMGDFVHVEAETRRLLGKQPSHQNSASLFLTFVAETSQKTRLNLNHRTWILHQIVDLKAILRSAIFLIYNNIDLRSGITGNWQTTTKRRMSSNFVVSSVYKRLRRIRSLNFDGSTDDKSWHNLLFLFRENGSRKIKIWWHIWGQRLKSPFSLKVWGWGFWKC
jgi:hypothetical protein